LKCVGACYRRESISRLLRVNAAAPRYVFNVRRQSFRVASDLNEGSLWLVRFVITERRSLGRRTQPGIIISVILVAGLVFDWLALLLLLLAAFLIASGQAVWRTGIGRQYANPIAFNV